MAKLYKLVYHFKDGKSWDEKTHDIALSADQIAFMLNEFQKPGSELTQESTGETRKASEIKSIELLF
ncbi:hypothetical protein [Bacillus sp. 37MA]|uniref:hypothetical protein n=1 Tax=Bacillus sp. 37MA TaxID=1132442 RepID=UPI00035C7A60|nr:hypothetical protein [Bacillus sp. 37MA]